MERRRFVPSGEGLEGRALLSIFNPTNLLSSTTSTSDTFPGTTQQKLSRIEHLPFFLENLQPGRPLPKSVTVPLQAGLVSIMGQLHGPPSQVIDQFDLTLRNTIPNASLSASNAAALNNNFGQVLTTAGADPASVAALKADMNAVAQLDSNSVNPVILATNDYSLVLQVALGVGRPLRVPNAPTLAAADTLGKGSNTTANPQPSLVGTYSPNTTIQILDSNFNVVGSSTVLAGGRYKVQFAEPLAPGVYHVRVRGFDAGLTSPPSRQFAFKVVGRPKAVQTTTAINGHPQGPLALGQG
jgi:hypothetical protein